MFIVFVYKLTGFDILRIKYFWYEFWIFKNGYLYSRGKVFLSSFNERRYCNTEFE